MIRRLPYYKKGAVHLEITGRYPEKFINFCIADQIYLWGVKQTQKGIVLWVGVDDFFRMRPAVRKSGVRVKVLSSYGLPFLLKRWKHRKIMSIGAVLFLFTLYLLNSYIWFIEIDGLKSISREKINSVLVSEGLEYGAKRGQVDVKKIEHVLMMEFPELAWTGVHVDGTKAFIEVVEKVRPETEDKNPADLIAAKDGIVTECIVFQGYPSVKVGDHIKEGDVLIHAATYSAHGSNGKGAGAGDLRAKGIVKARIQYESTGEANRNLVEYTKTGEREVSVQLNLSGDVYTLKSADFDQFSAFEKEEIVKSLPWWRNSNFIVELVIDIYRELEYISNDLDEEAAKNQAATEALRLSKYLIPQDAYLLGSRIETEPSEDDATVRVKMYVETEEEVGTYRTRGSE